MNKHKHHIIPKHAGGTDDPDNLVELTIEEHAEEHRKLYEKHGKWQDKLAWMGLANLAPCAEIKYQALVESMKGENNPMWGKPAPNRGVSRPGIGGRKKGTKWSEKERATQAKIRDESYYDYLKTEEHRQKYIGENNPNYGKEGANTGKKIYNNGFEERYFYEGEQENGFILGSIKARRIGIKKGLRWYNNGQIDKQYRDGEQPKGFTHGRICKKSS